MQSQGLPGIFLHFFSLPLDLLALVVGEEIVRYERIVRIRHECVQGAHGFRFFLFFWWAPSREGLRVSLRREIDRDHFWLRGGSHPTFKTCVP